MLKRWSSVLAVLVVVAVAAGCASQKAPAQAALTASEQAFAAVKGEATKYLPNEVGGVEQALAAAKSSFDKGDYQAALTAAQALPARIGALSTAVAAKKAELTTTWTALSAALPQVVQVIQSRVDILSKSKKLPAGMDAATFDAAKSGLATVTQAWGEATAAANSGDLAGAVAKANTVKTKAGEILGALGMQVPAGLK
jgi:hypothetical protein